MRNFSVAYLRMEKGRSYRGAGIMWGNSFTISEFRIYFDSFSLNKSMLNRLKESSSFKLS